MGIMLAAFQMQRDPVLAAIGKAAGKHHPAARPVARSIRAQGRRIKPVRPAVGIFLRIMQLRAMAERSAAQQSLQRIFAAAALCPRCLSVTAPSCPVLGVTGRLAGGHQKTVWPGRCGSGAVDLSYGSGGDG
ncbi:hypothetical protein MACH17_44120 [Phaeobacter inhibens]|nr:hypothetical protein MACH17_44120 [Phaeobacter inhibens]